ncbi:MAG: DUF4038 domain-containing protein, partial [Bacteroidota bacterium]|nr:DUF4038 domain-containing protein [Bacteroidota bacterium]
MKACHLFRICNVVGFLLIAILTTTNAQSVSKFGVFETSFTHSGTISNPFTSLEGSVTFTSPSSKTFTIPMFWDGSTTWKVRFSPNETGSWSYTTSSSNSGLSGQSGTFTCTSSSNKGGIRQKQGSPLHFQYENGDNMYFIGDTQWDLFIDRPEASLNLTSVKTYFDVRSSQDFNAIHATLVRGSANEGGNAFPTKYSVLNPGYFQAVDTRIKYANDKGLTIGIAIISGENIKTHIAGGGSESDIIRIAKYAAARYSAYNVYFLLGMEYQEANRSSTFWNNMGNTLANADPHDRLIGNHSGGMMVSREYSSQSWAGFGDYMQMQDKSRQYSEAITSRSYSKPVVNGEYGYYQVTEGPGIENSLDSMRARTYNIAMAGAYAVTGFGPTYAGGRRSPSNPLFNPNYPSSADWAEDFKYLKRVFSSVDYWTLTPNNNLISGSGTKYVLANVGNQYFVYIKGNSGSNTLSLGTQTSKTYTVQRYDPRLGSFTDLSGYTGNSSIAFANPDNKDWIYIVKATGPSTNNPPTISSLTASTTTGVVPLAVNFSVSASDPEGDALTYSWDLNGDGTYNEGTASSVSYNYSIAGTYAATVRVSDGTNSAVTSSVVITVSGSGSGSVVNGSIPWTEDFALTNGTNSDNGSTSWSLITTGVNSGAIASVQNNELQFSNLGVEAKWLSGPISVSGAGDIKISARLNSSNAGTLEV